jgi:hypothetical protein
MERHYSLPAMGRRLVQELARIERKVLGGAAVAVEGGTGVGVRVGTRGDEGTQGDEGALDEL